MLARFILLSAVLFVTACSTTQEPGLADSVPVQDREQITTETGLRQDDMNAVKGEGLAAPGNAAQMQESLVQEIGDRVFFGYDSYTLTTAARQTLLAQAKWLQAYSSLNITIEGHCDERGTREYNLALGERRANAAKEYLVALGVDADRVSVVSYGKERPAVAASNEAAWAQNRRAVTTIQ